jgi:quercetin dioxygenase-like cupin family protein/pimeloyl-ACP methyl ester carboxylesterase
MNRMRVIVVLALIVGSGVALQAAAQQQGVTRTNLQRHDLSVPGREVIQVRVDIAPGVVFPRHSHPGEEIVYAIEGSLEYRVDGKPPVTLRPGQVLFIPAGAVHAVKNVGRDNGAELATYLVEKGKPLLLLASPSYAQTVAPATKERTMSTQVQHTPPASTQPLAAGEDTTLRPFQFRASETALAELRRRIQATQWPEKETVTDDSQGVPLAAMQQLARYWSTDYDWRKAEARLNALPQFMTNIDGLDIHFIHVRSRHPNALPLVVSHGWPGSIIEQLKIIEPLTNPTAYGGNASDAFHVVIPSMPGYGFSAKPTTPGWGPERMARAWDVLMKRLGYTRYVAQGGDWGAFVVDQMGLQAPAGLLAIHTNMPATVPADVDKAALAGGPPPAGLSAEERRAYEQLVRTFKQVQYAVYMAARPQTLYGIADSPVGLAAWLLDHNDADGQPAVAVASALNRTTSATGELTRDEILDNITLYWLTNTGVSSSRLYWEYKGGFFNAKGVAIPVAVTVFPGEQYEAPRSWAERAYPKLIYYNKVDKGGHFAAWEQPRLFAAELRAAFKSLR